MSASIPSLDLWAVPLRGSRLLEASAGTGKTWTLSALVVRLVLGEGGPSDYAQPLQPAQILVMTFTRAATRELSDRIRTRLDQAARVLRHSPDTATLCAQDAFLASLHARYPEGGSGPTGLSREQAAWRLAQAAESMDEAAIFTLDAWCQRVLREHAFASGQLFEETLLPDPALLLAQAVRDHWRAQVYPLPPALLRRLRQQCGALASVQKLEKDVESVLDAPLPVHPPFSPSLAWDDPRLSLAEVLAQTHQQRLAQVAHWQARCAQPLGELAQWLQTQITQHPAHWNGQKFAPQRVAGWARTLLAWVQAPDATQPPVLNDTAWKRLTPAALHDARKAKAPPLHLPPAVEQALQCLAELRAAAPDWPSPCAAARAHAAAQVGARLARLKARDGVYGFADLPRRLAHALAHPVHGPALRAHILQRYPVALIDEFQDTSPLQLRLLDALYRIQANDPAHAVLLIGDPKQSIYAFRGADIRSYLQAKRATEGRHHVLAVNHRSSAAVVAAVNHLFAWREQAAGVGAFRMGAGEGAASPVPFVRVQARGRAERWRVAGQPAPALTVVCDAQWRAADAQRRALAERCAQQVVQWLSDPHTGFEHPTDPFKRLHPQDVAVLVRTGHEAAWVRAALARRGVASVFVSDRDSVFQTPEAADLLRWLQAVAQPRDVRLARAAWGTRLAGLSVQELRTLAHDDDALDARMALLARLHTVWRQRGVLALVRQSLFVAGWPQRWLAQPDGERRLTNVLHLAELLQTAATTLDGETALIRWLHAQIEADAPAGDDALVRLESDRNLVQILTIHTSKGLEYPVVMLPFATAYRAADDKLQHTPRPAHPEQQDDPQAWALTLSVQAADKTRAEEARLAEDLRLLYVALTRAQHVLWVGWARQGTAKTDLTHRSALGYLVAGDAPPADWLAQLHTLAAACPPDPESGTPVWVVQAAADAPPQVWTPPQPPAALHAPRRLTRGFDTTWTLSSFSRLTQDLHTANAAPHAAEASAAAGGTDAGPPPSPLWPLPKQPADDERLEEKSGSPLLHPLSDATFFEASSDIRHRFWRGPQGGNWLHAQLQWLAQEGFALARHTGLAAQLRQRCVRQGFGAEADALVAWLAEVCEHPLPGVGAALADVQTPLAEMAFWLPTQGLDARAVGECCRQHLLEPLARWAGQPQLAQDVPVLPARTLHGLLLGFVDVVFAHQGRHWVLDHKSNHLGPGDAAYTPAALVQAVVHHRYDVQAALYALALHRLLRSRLGAAYQPQQHLGGACYVFLRGLRGPARGACVMPMPLPLLHTLEAML